MNRQKQNQNNEYGEGQHFDLERWRKKIKFRAGHRGMRELDILIGGYIDAHIHEMDASALSWIETVLHVPDQIFYGILVGAMEIPETLKHQQMEALLHHVRQRVSKKYF